MKYDWINLIFFGQGGSIPVYYQYGINVYALFTMKFIFRLDRRKRHFQVSLNVNPILFVQPVIEISAEKTPFATSAC